MKGSDAVYCQWFGNDLLFFFTDNSKLPQYYLRSNFAKLISSNSDRKELHTFIKSAKKITVILDDRDYSLVSLTQPRVSGKDLIKSLRYKAAQQLDYDPDTIYSDYFRLPEDKADFRRDHSQEDILVAVVEKSIVSRRIKQLCDLGIQLSIDKIIVPELLLSGYLSVYKPEINHTLLFYAKGRQGKFIYFENNRPRLVQPSADLTLEEGSFVHKFEIIVAINYLIQHFNLNKQSNTMFCYYDVEQQFNDERMAFISEELNVTFKSLIDPSIHSDAADGSSIIGQYMDQFNADFNLYQRSWWKNDKYFLSLKGWFKVFLSYGLLLFILYLILFVWIKIDMNRNTVDISKISKKKPLSQYSIPENYKALDDNFYEPLKKLSDQKIAGVWLTNIYIENSEKKDVSNRVVFKGYANNSSSLYRFIKRIKEIPEFESEDFNLLIVGAGEKKEQVFNLRQLINQDSSEDKDKKNKSFLFTLSTGAEEKNEEDNNASDR